MTTMQRMDAYTALVEVQREAAIGRAVLGVVDSGLVKNLRGHELAAFLVIACKVGRMGPIGMKFIEIALDAGISEDTASRAIRRLLATGAIGRLGSSRGGMYRLCPANGPD